MSDNSIRARLRRVGLDALYAVEATLNLIEQDATNAKDPLTIQVAGRIRDALERERDRLDEAFDTSTETDDA